MVDLHPAELKGTGLCPNDFELLNDVITPEVAREKGFHPDDQHREEQMKLRGPEKSSLNTPWLSSAGR